MMKKWTALLVLSAGLLSPACSHADAYIKAYAGGVFPPVCEAFSEANRGSGTGDLEYSSGLTYGIKVGEWMKNAPYLGYELDLNGHVADLEELTVKGSSPRVDATGEQTGFSPYITLSVT